jgi:hypothetical protein
MLRYVVHIITAGLSVTNVLSKFELALADSRVHKPSYTFEHKIYNHAVFGLLLISTLKIILYFVLKQA